MVIKKKFYLSGHVTEWHRLCFVKYLNCENFIWQKSQENCISPWWTLLRIVKQSDLANFFEHMSQEKGFSPVWTLLWRFKLVIWEKAIWHWSQAKGFEWILLWIFNWLGLGNLFGQVSHLCFLMEESTLNLFNFGIENRSSLIVDGYELTLFVSLIAVTCNFSKVPC